jgi:hypothetical protein
MILRKHSHLELQVKALSKKMTASNVPKTCKGRDMCALPGLLQDALHHPATGVRKTLLLSIRSPDIPGPSLQALPPKIYQSKLLCYKQFKIGQIQKPSHSSTTKTAKSTTFKLLVYAHIT